MELLGQVEEIIYQNELNSYTIAVLETDEEDITIVGYLPFVLVGDFLSVTGDYVEHPTYGMQFKVQTFEKKQIETVEALEKYLASGIIKGIGPATAKKIVKVFGKDTVNVFKTEPYRLASIKGISDTKAVEIAEEFNEKWDMWKIVGYLEQFGIGASNSQKVYKSLGKNAVEEIEKNPYVLLDIAYGVDFKQIDNTALKLGISVDNEKRIESAVKYSLSIVSYNGHTCVLKENLIKFVQDLTGVDELLIETSIINLNVREEIIIEKREEYEWVYLYAFYKAEDNIVKKLITLKDAKNIKNVNKFAKQIQEREKEYKIVLSEKQ
ncbi:MAG: ATP-dependent RecD-like DNA helicase, partial [Lachnospiraceae bacterium]|nr:ATP-dependent RecD-like DNA helicase [Lachnospiraceae bacterium]